MTKRELCEWIMHRPSTAEMDLLVRRMQFDRKAHPKTGLIPKKRRSSVAMKAFRKALSVSMATPAPSPHPACTPSADAPRTSRKP